MILRSNDVDLFYEIRGQGPDVVMLHPYPSDHTYWLPMAPSLESRFRLILPDLRGLGRSVVDEEVTSMATLAEDLLRLCDELKVERATFVGCSVGGYVLFEFWRRYRERVKALILMDTKAGVDSDEGRVARLKNADDVLQLGPEWAIEQMMPKLLSPVTMSSRLDVVERGKETMRKGTAAGFSAMQRGMAARADSDSTLAAIDVPVLVLGGEDDAPSPVSELAKIAKGVQHADLKVIRRAGHFAAFEQPEEVGRLVREFLERVGR